MNTTHNDSTPKQPDEDILTELTAIPWASAAATKNRAELLNCLPEEFKAAESILFGTQIEFWPVFLSKLIEDAKSGDPKRPKQSAMLATIDAMTMLIGEPELRKAFALLVMKDLARRAHEELSMLQQRRLLRKLGIETI